jgi:hypothetical protein
MPSRKGGGDLWLSSRQAIALLAKPSHCQLVCAKIKLTIQLLARTPHHQILLSVDEHDWEPCLIKFFLVQTIHEH